MVDLSEPIRRLKQLERTLFTAEALNRSLSERRAHAIDERSRALRYQAETRSPKFRVTDQRQRDLADRQVSLAQSAIADIDEQLKALQPRYQTRALIERGRLLLAACGWDGGSDGLGVIQGPVVAAAVEAAQTAATVAAWGATS